MRVSGFSGFGSNITFKSNALTSFTQKILPFLLLSFLVLTVVTVRAQEQVAVHGAVFNMYKTKPLEGVSVICTSGKGTTTDANGNYYIVVGAGDSLSFSYLGRETAKFAVSAIRNQPSFDIALHVDPVELKEVRVIPRNYTMDSIQNRKDYEKIFNYKKPGFKITDPTTNGGLAAGVDLDALINIFRFQKKRQTLAFQRRLVEEEQDKSVDHRFNRGLVKKITKLDSMELDTFMVRYRPSYSFSSHASDYDFYEYIKLAYKQYMSDRKDRP
jgi:hypothetical protein